MDRTWQFFAAAVLFILALTPRVQAEEIPAPPWLMTGTHGIEIGYALDETVVRRLLPEGVEPVAEMTGGIELYVSPGGFGIAPYSAFNVFVDVEGMDMPDGRKGRWMLMGRYGPSEQVAAALRTHYGWPVQAGSARVQKRGSTWIWTGTADGSDFIEVRIKRKTRECEAHSGLDYWAGKPQSRPVLINPIPNTYCWREVDVTGLKVHASAAFPLNALQPGNAPLAYAVEWENGAWSFTTPFEKP